MATWSWQLLLPIEEEVSETADRSETQSTELSALTSECCAAGRQMGAHTTEGRGIAYHLAAVLCGGLFHSDGPIFECSGTDVVRLELVVLARSTES
jgi:hypothetical protein